MFERVSQAGCMETRVVRAQQWRGRRALPLLIGSVWVLNCTAAEAPLTSTQTRWLQRATYGVDANSATQLTQLGPKRFGALLLQPSDDAALPAPVRVQLQRFDGLHTTLVDLLTQYEADKVRLQAMPDGDEKVALKKDWQARGGRCWCRRARRNCCARCTRRISCASNWCGSGLIISACMPTRRG